MYGCVHLCVCVCACFIFDRFTRVNVYTCAFKVAYTQIHTHTHTYIHTYTHTGVKDSSALDETRAITLAMGEYFQIQDDVLDCYADPETLGMCMCIVFL